MPLHLPSVHYGITAAELLRHTLAEAAARSAGGAAVRIGDLLRPLGPRSGALGAALLALPFLSPVSLGPITTPAAAAIAILGWHLLRGSAVAPLPERLLGLEVPRRVLHPMAQALDRVLARTVRASRARHLGLVEGERGRRICGAGVVAGALLLAIPVPLVPLTNTLPALAILCFVLGWTHRDGLLTFWGAAAAVGSALLFAALAAAVVLVGWSSLPDLLPWSTVPWIHNQG